MLKVAGDGRRAALDLRLVGLAPDPDGGKVVVAAERIAAIYREHRDTIYADPSGRPSPNRGSLQVVFCDLGTPKGGDEWSVYREVRHQLAARGVPERLVRFIHEATDDQAKADLFAACREGRVAVLIGSTEKMGVGTNVQRRLTALHHLDAPWRPADIAQREGRALRQGNQNAEVAINRYVTEGSFDVFMWQTLERKQAFIHQVMSGESPDRDVEDIGDIALSFAEIKALATGNPLIMEKAGIDNDIARLQRLRQAHLRDQTALARRVTAAEAGAARAEQRSEHATRAIAERADTKGDAFAMTIGGTVLRKRSEAGEELEAVLASIEKQGHAAARLDERGTTTTTNPVGQLAGFPLSVEGQHDRHDSRLVLRLDGTPVEVSLTSPEGDSANGERLVARLESRLRGLDAVAAAADEDAERLWADADAARSRLGQPFNQEQTLTSFLRWQTQINEQLASQDPSAGPVHPLPSQQTSGHQEHPNRPPMDDADRAEAQPRHRPPPAAQEPSPPAGVDHPADDTGPRVDHRPHDPRAADARIEDKPRPAKTAETVVHPSPNTNYEPNEPRDDIVQRPRTPRPSAAAVGADQVLRESRTGFIPAATDETVPERPVENSGPIIEAQRLAVPPTAQRPSQKNADASSGQDSSPGEAQRAGEPHRWPSLNSSDVPPAASESTPPAVRERGLGI